MEILCSSHKARTKIFFFFSKTVIDLESNSSILIDASYNINCISLPAAKQVLKAFFQKCVELVMSFASSEVLISNTHLMPHYMMHTSAAALRSINLITPIQIGS